MGLMSAITGNTTKVSESKIQEAIGPLLVEGEKVDKAYQMIRDFFVFTNTRLILVDIQGVTGKKVEYHSIPYHSITTFTVETAGWGIDDSELTLHIHGIGEIKKEFKKSIDITEVQRALAKHLLN